MILRCILIVFANVISLAAITQTDSLNIIGDYRIYISSKVINGLKKEYTSTHTRLGNASEEILKKWEKYETDLYKQLFEKSNNEKMMFLEEFKIKHSEMQDELYKPTEVFERFALKEYMPGIDSVQTALAFLKQTELPLKKIQELEVLNSSLKDLQTELQKANDIQAFLKDRTSILNDRLMKNGYIKSLKQINKNIYYYQSRIAEYKSMLTDKQKFKCKFLATVRTMSAFQKFWQKNSYLAQLFSMPGNYNSTAQALPGLQTTTSIQQTLQQRFGMQTIPATTSNITGSDFFQQQAGTARQELNRLKDKINNASGSNSDITTPDFKPNEQKTKSFFKRLEYGVSFQSDKGTALLPATTDIAGNLGYKISDRKVIGIGISYKFGWGSGWDNIKLSSEGVGLRSYIDIKVKGGLWLSGGAEYNYLSAFKNLRELHDQVDMWQGCALLGITKKYKIGKRKEGKIQVLYDFLHNQQTSPSQGLKLRVGWNF